METNTEDYTTDLTDPIDTFGPITPLAGETHITIHYVPSISLGKQVKPHQFDPIFDLTKAPSHQSLPPEVCKGSILATKGLKGGNSCQKHGN